MFLISYALPDGVCLSGLHRRHPAPGYSEITRAGSSTATMPASHRKVAEAHPLHALRPAPNQFIQRSQKIRPGDIFLIHPWDTCPNTVAAKIITTKVLSLLSHFRQHRATIAVRAAGHAHHDMLIRTPCFSRIASTLSVNDGRNARLPPLPAGRSGTTRRPLSFHAARSRAFISP